MTEGVQIEQIFVAIRAGYKSFDKDLSEASKSLKKFGRQAGQMGDAFTKAFSLPLAAVGTLAIRSANQMEEAYGKIRAGTGATGDALKQLNTDFEAVFKEVPASAGEVADAIAGISTRTGQTGQGLQTLTKTIIDLADVTGGQAAPLVASMTRVFGDWSIATDKQVESLDFLFKVSQQTGIGVDHLGQLIVQYGAPLRQFGFSFEEAAVLMGKFEKEGVNTETVMGGLRAGLGKLSKSGIDLKAGLSAVMEGIKNAGTAAQANGIAIEVFGQKAGPDFAAAVREGRFGIEELLKAIESSEETIAKADDASETTTEKIAKVWNTLTIAMGKVGAEIYNVAEPAIKFLAEGIGQLSNWFSELSPQVKNAIVVIGGFAAGAGPVLIAVKAIALALSALLGVPALVVAAFAGLYIAWQTWGEDVTRFFTDLVGFIKEKFDNIRNIALITQKFLQNLKSQALQPIDAWNQAVAEVETQLAVVEAKERKATEAFQKGSEILAKKGQLTEKHAEQLKTAGAEAEATGEQTLNLADVLKKLGENTGGAAGSTADLTKEWAQLKAEFAGTNIQVDLTSQIEKAIENVDQASFDNLKNQFAKTVEEGIYATLKEKYGEAIPDGEIRAQAQSEAAIKADEWGTKMAERQQEVYQEGVDFWRTSFENAITGTTFDLKDALKQVAVGFAAQMAQAMFGSIGGGVGSPQDLGGSIFQSIFGGGTAAQGGGFNLSSIFGGGTGGSGAGLMDIFGGGLTGQAPGIQGPVMENGAFSPDILGQGTNASSAASSLGTAAAAYNVMSTIGALGDNTEGTAEAIGTAAGTALGAVFGGPVGAGVGSTIGRFAGKAIGGMLGGSPSNPETLARMEAAKQIAEAMEKAGGVMIQTADGFKKVTELNANLYNNFRDFDAQRDFFGKFEANGSKSGAGAFLGTGNALSSILGLENLDGGQLAAMLGDAFEYQMDGIKGLADAMGFTFEDVKNELVLLGKQGELTWLEVTSQIRDVGEAFKPGIEGTGNWQKAMDALAASAGRGQISIGAVANIGVEAAEAGITSFEALKQQMYDSGKYSTEFIDAFFAGIEQAGIKSFDQLSKLGDEQLGAIVASMDAYLQDHGVKWEELSKKIGGAREQVDQIAAALDQLNGREANVTVNVKVNETGGGTETLANKFGNVFSGGQLQKYAMGGIVNSPTYFKHSGGTGLMGEAGAEAIMPLTRIGGKLGVMAKLGGGGGSVVQFNIDASGAAAGVEGDIMRVLSDVEDRIVNRTLNAVAEISDRGGFR